MIAVIEYYARALTKGKFSLISFAIQPLSFVFIVYVVSGGRFLNTALAGAIVSFVVGVGLADLAIELVGMKTRSHFYDIILSLPGSNWKKALGISLGMSVPALPYVILLIVLLTLRLGLRAFLGIIIATGSLWMWSTGTGFLIGVKGEEPVRVRRLTNLIVTGLTIFPPVYYPIGVLPGWIAKVLLILPTVSASQVISTGGSGVTISIAGLWGIAGLVLLMTFKELE